MRADIRVPNATRSRQVAQRDPLLKSLLTKSPKEIVSWWQNATREQKDAATIRVILLVAGLARNEFKDE